MKRLPTFIVIGAMKCGTTSLYRYLAGHPEITVSNVKETNFFLGRQEYTRGLDWYCSLYQGQTAAIGEVSPNYSKRHKWGGVPARIASVVPDVSLINVVRDPVERVISHWTHNYAHGRECHPFSRAIRARPNYVNTSLYAYQINAYLEFFSREQIHFVDASALEHDTRATLSGVFRFLGVATDVELPHVDERLHRSDEKHRTPWLDRATNPHRLRKLVRPFLPARLTEFREFERPALSEPDGRFLADAIRPDAERFREITDMPFSSWPV